MPPSSPKTVTVLARFKAQKGKHDQVKQALLSLIPPTRSEPGCINYDLHQSPDDPCLFMFHENWASRTDLDKHLQTPHVQAAAAKAVPLLAEPFEITVWERIGS